jgi:hypothetical protein
MRRFFQQTGFHVPKLKKDSSEKNKFSLKKEKLKYLG